MAQATVHRVRSGETLTSIAARYGVTVAALAAANDMSTRDVLRVGVRLTIPEGAAASAAREAAPAIHRVQSGENLSTIARRYGVTVAALAAANDLNPRGVLRAGARLVIPAGSTPAAVRAASRRSRVVVPIYANSTAEDVADYDDPVVREAAVSALGRYNGSIVAVDPNTGLILTIVNQKLAFSSGFIPCSTIKPVIALAALEERVIERDTMIQVARGRYLNLVEAMARSNNPFFEELGRRMGFDTVSRYARLFGLGELAGYGIPEEQPGGFPSAPPANGGVARMSSFGEGIQMTLLQLASLVSTISNGGTMYYLQYPRTAEERENFFPRIKRRLDIAPILPEIRDGMLAAVLYGTGKQSYDGEGEQPLGKTGTCSEAGARLGWFVSYADQANPRIVVAVLVRGSSRSISGSKAAEIAGRFYKSLYASKYFENYLVRRPGAAAPEADTGGASPGESKSGG